MQSGLDQLLSVGRRKLRSVGKAAEIQSLDGNDHDLAVPVRRHLRVEEPRDLHDPVVAGARVDDRVGVVRVGPDHDNCEEIYYVISGRGFAGAGSDRVEVHGGHFHYIPSGVEHWLYNIGETEPIEVVGIYVGAGSVAETGYVYMGDVTEDDLERRVVAPRELGKR